MFILTLTAIILIGFGEIGLVKVRIDRKVLFGVAFPEIIRVETNAVDGHRLADPVRSRRASVTRRGETERRPGAVRTGRSQKRGSLRSDSWIPDLELALKDGYTSGNGMGLGLGGAKRLSNEFEISSKPGEGTRVCILRWKLG